MRIIALSASIAVFSVLASGCTIPGLDPFAVSEPKNLAAVTDPCQLLKPEQLEGLNVGAPVAGRSLWGQADCSWKGMDKNTVRIAPDTVEGDGIKTVAGNSTPNGRPTHEVDGYPAVRSGDASIMCTVHVATSEKDALLLSFSPSYLQKDKPEFSDACVVADKAAAMVLSNLPPE